MLYYVRLSTFPVMSTFKIAKLYTIIDKNVNYIKLPAASFANNHFSTVAIDEGQPLPHDDLYMPAN